MDEGTGDKDTKKSRVQGFCRDKKTLPSAWAARSKGLARGIHSSFTGSKQGSAGLFSRTQEPAKYCL